ncbi:MAG: arginine deiminase-related protein [Planctomycetota bacterium]|nr:arginine deiminase-related protein [Planctomycetota bacterium]
MPRFLMCPPDYYGIEYEINPWMSRQRQSDQVTAKEQWNGLVEKLRLAGATIELLPPVRGLPDLVFTANAALIYQNRAIMARFRHPERQKEVQYDEEWLAANGFAIEHVAEDLHFEGAGDALFCGDTLFAGYRIRSHARGHQLIGETLGCRVLPLELVDEYYYHLDTCFCPLSPTEAIWFPAAFDDYGRQTIQAHVPTLVEVHEEEARHFACNAVVVGKTVVTNVGCPLLHESLRKLGYSPQETPLDEFVKAGGSAKCLTLRLDGEEAASWRVKD